MKKITLCGIATLYVLNVSHAETKPKYGPQGAPKATSIAVSNEYFRSPKHPAPDFWALTGYYVPQINGYSCSCATVAMVLNAARSRLPKTADDQVILQKDLLDKVTTEQWKARLSPEGVGGEHGTDLDRLAKIVLDAFKAYGFKNASVKTVHVKDTSSKSKQEVMKALQENEKSTKDFIISNFNQQKFTDDADVGHIAPVGAYDAERGRVLIFDPDREYYEPYWISVDSFLAGMATVDKSTKANRGYLIIRTGN